MPRAVAQEETGPYARIAVLRPHDGDTVDFEAGYSRHLWTGTDSRRTPGPGTGGHASERPARRLRQHLRQRGFALTVVSTLALTMARPPPSSPWLPRCWCGRCRSTHPSASMWIASVRPDNPDAPFSLPEFLDYRSRTQTIAGLAAYASWNASLAEDGVTERLAGARLSGNAFDVLGLSPAAGRLLNEADDRADAPPVVVAELSPLAAAPGGGVEIVGKRVRINGEPFVVVGVLPARFPLPLRDLDVVTALAPDRDPLRHVRNSVNFLRVFGRLAPGADARQAQSELTAICRSLRQQFPTEVHGERGGEGDAAARGAGRRLSAVDVAAVRRGRRCAGGGAGEPAVPRTGSRRRPARRAVGADGDRRIAAPSCAAAGRRGAAARAHRQRHRLDAGGTGDRRSGGVGTTVCAAARRSHPRSQRVPVRGRGHRDRDGAVDAGASWRDGPDARQRRPSRSQPRGHRRSLERPRPKRDGHRRDLRIARAGAVDDCPD